MTLQPGQAELISDAIERLLGDRHVKHCNPWHRHIVTEYRAARTAAELAHDIAYGGTTTEDREHRGELITFKTFLIGLRGGVDRDLADSAA